MLLPARTRLVVVSFVVFCVVIAVAGMSDAARSLIGSAPVASSEIVSSYMASTVAAKSAQNTGEPANSTQMEPMFFTPSLVVNYDFASAVAGTPCTASALTTAAGVTSTFTTGGTGGGTCTTPAGTATGVGAFAANVSNQSVSLTSFAAASTNYFQFQVGGVSNRVDYVLYFQTQRSATGPVNADVQYSLDGSSFTTFVTISPPTSFGASTIDLSAVAAIEGQPTVYFRIVGRDGTNVAGTFRIDNFQVQADVLAPEMNVKGNSVSIADGDATPSLADHTDFGSANSVTRTFTIENLGTANLTLSGAPFVQVSGPNAADFTVTSQPTSPIAASGSTTFTVNFHPATPGLKTATLSIGNDDADENPYDFAIQGTGVNAPLVYVDDDWTGFADGTVITDADPVAAGNQPATFGTDAFATIQAGVNNVTPGGTVKVNPHGPFAVPTGSYAENVSIIADVTLDGNGGASGATAADVVIDPAAGDGITITGSGSVTIRDLRVTDAVDGIKASGLGNFTITNVKADLNTDDGLDVAGVGAVITTSVTANSNGDAGMVINTAASYADTDGTFSLNTNHGIQLIDITGLASLTRTTANDDDANIGGVGDGVNIIDGVDAGTDAIGSLQVTGGSFSDTAAAGVQRYGIRVGDGIGVGAVHSVGGTVVFQSDGSAGPLQHISITGNRNSGVEIEDAGTTASITGAGTYSSNLGTGFTVSSLSGTFTVDGSTFSSNGSHGISLTDITGAVNLTGAAVNDNGGNGLNAVDGGDAGTDAVGGLTISGSTFNNTAAANVQLTGINVGPNTGSTTFNDNGAVANSVTGNTAGGVVLGTIASTASITSTNGAAYSSNTGGPGMSIASLGGALSVSGITASSNGTDGLTIGDGGTTAGIGGTFSSNGGNGIILNTGVGDLSGAFTLTNVTADSNTLDGVQAINLNSTVAITGGTFNSNGDDGMDITSIGAVTTTGVTANTDGDAGLVIHTAASYADTDGVFTRDTNHGIQLVDIAGLASLTRTTANDDDANNGGIGDGVNIIDGPDAGTDAVGSLQVTGGSFSDTAAAGVQRFGIRVGDGIGVGAVHSVGGTVVFQNDGIAGPLQNLNITGNFNSGVEIEDGGTTASVAGGNYSGNLGNGFSIASLSSTFNGGGTFSSNGSHGISLLDITGAVSLTGAAVNDNGGNGLNAVDGGDGDMDAVGGLTISGSSFNNTAAANAQLTGINVGPNTGSVTFNDNGAIANSVTGNTAAGVVLGPVAGTGSITSTNGATYSSNTNGSGISIASLGGALTVSGITASSNLLDGLNIGGGTTAAIGGTFNSNGDDGVDLLNFSGAVTTTSVTANSNGDAGMVINTAASYADTDGTFSLNTNHGIQLIDITGLASLTRTTANDDDANIGGVGDGVNIIDGVDAGTDAIGSLQVTGGSFSDTAAAGVQRYGIRVGDGIGVGAVHSVGGTVVFQSDGSAGPLQHISITGNRNSGVEIEDAGTTASITGAGTYSSNLGDGFAIASLSGSFTVNGNTFSSNGGNGLRLVSLSGSGSQMTATTINANTRGVNATSSNLDIIRSTLSNNVTTSGNNGGGILLTGGTVGVINSTISGNTATSALGGGIFVSAGTLNLSNATVTNNTATQGGGVSNAGTVNSRSTIVSGNNAATGPDFSGTVTSSGYNLVGKGDGSIGFTGPADQVGSVAVPIDAKLQPLANYGGPTLTHALQLTSPAIDKGINAVVPLTTDQRGPGFARTVEQTAILNPGDGTDIGAFEEQSFTITSVTSSVNPSVFGQPVTFTATVSTVPSGGSPTGTVTFTVDGVPVCSNVPLNGSFQATCSTSSITAAGSPHAVVATYSGNANLIGSAGSLAGGQTVNKANTTTMVTSSLNPSSSGTPVTFTATITTTPPGAGVPVGTVNFLDGANPIAGCQNVAVNGAGQAQCTTSSLTSGNHTINANYSGNANFNASTGSVVQVVDLPPTATGTAPNVVTSGGTTHTVTVTYADDVAINVSTIDSNDIRVTGPNAFNQAVTLTNLNNNTNGTPRVATYTFTTPGGTWDIGDNGTYNIVMQANQVFDSANQPVPAGTIGTFTVNIPPVTISGNIKQFVQGGPNTNLAGVTVTLTSNNVPVPAPTTTDASGNYSFAGLSSGGNYVVTPTMAGKVFDPLNRTFNNVTTNTVADFVAYNTGAIPRIFSIPTSFVTPGQTVSIPIVVQSQGNEAFMAFSLAYDFNLFNTPVVNCGSSTPGCAVAFTNPSQGVVGITITPAAVLNAGPREIARLTLTSVATNATSSPITFTDNPTVRLVKNATGDPLPAAYTNGTIVFAQGIEGDIATQFTGDGQLLSNDVTLVRQMVVGTLVPNPLFNEFQRADSAPRASSGDGQIDAADTIQTRRYVAGLDPLQPAGGFGAPPSPPLGPIANEARAETDTSREIGIATAVASPGGRTTVSIEMNGSGNEAAASFTISFDANKLSNPHVSLGSGVPASAVLTTNLKNAANGKIAVLVDSAEAFVGSQVVTVTFDVAPNAAGGETPLRFTGTLAAQGTSDTEGNPLRTKYTDGKVTIAGPAAPAVQITGRLSNSMGQGLRNVDVVLTDSAGKARNAITSSLGYYRFEDVEPGQEYTISVASKRYRVEARTVLVDASLADVDLVAIDRQ